MSRLTNSNEVHEAIQFSQEDRLSSDKYLSFSLLTRCGFFALKSDIKCTNILQWFSHSLFTFTFFLLCRIKFFLKL